MAYNMTETDFRDIEEIEYNISVLRDASKLVNSVPGISPGGIIGEINDQIECLKCAIEDIESGERAAWDKAEARMTGSLFED